ncbi:MAG: GPW/gp25 family protein [Betaproteobacteria bacterium]|nr:GPW/gp25 family protein [Betaproteobacteria bacterium]
MDCETGVPLEELEHIRQSVAKIVTTPIGTRVMRRDYGSRVPDLIDAPINARVRLLVMAATATALIKWEPRIRPARIELKADGPALTVALTAALTSGPTAGQTVLMMIPLR